MSTKRAFLTILATSALLVGLGIGFHLVGAQSSSHLLNSTFTSSETETGWSIPQYIVQLSTVVGGDYQVTSLTCPANRVSSGGDYQLQSLAGSGAWGNCCCTFLPIVRRNP